MTRLVNEMRADIVDKMIAHTFGAEITVIHTRTASLAYDIYNDVFTSQERKQMANLPTGWLPTDDDIFIKVDEAPGQKEISHRFRFDGNWSAWHGSPSAELCRRNVKEIKERFPASKNGQCGAVYSATDNIGVLAAALLEDAHNLADRISDARTKLRATLDTFFTVEKLTDAWPDIAPFVPEPPAPLPPISVPALPVADLNAMFKLPVSA